jgi:hypothetical protein
MMLIRAALGHFQAGVTLAQRASEAEEMFQEVSKHAIASANLFDPQGDSKQRAISEENATEPQKAAQNPAQFGPVTSTIDPDVSRVIDAWPTLPAPIRAAILALVNSAAG